jgi:hypothetical protein
MTRRLRAQRSPAPPVGLIGRWVGRAMSVVAATATVLQLTHTLAEKPDRPRRRRRYGILETNKKTYFGIGDRVKYGKEYLRTTSGTRLVFRRGQVTRVRRLTQYQGDPNPRQLVTVTWDGDEEPSKVLNESLRLVSRDRS